MKNLIEKNKELLKMLGGVAVVVASAAWGLNNQMNKNTLMLLEKISAGDKALAEQINTVEKNLSSQIHALDNRLTIVETILKMNGFPLRALTKAQIEPPKDGT